MHTPRCEPKPLRSQGHGALALLLVLCGTSWMTGCFDAEAMIDSRKKMVQLTRLEEVDLGSFRVTLPYQPQSNYSFVVDFHAFGRVTHSNYKKVTRIIERRGPELKHRMLIAVRELELQELQEPTLDTLRINIEQVVNEALVDHPMQAIGFYRFSLLTK